MKHLFSLSAVAIGVAIAAAMPGAQEPTVSETAKLQKMTGRFAPTEITADLSRLSAGDRQVLGKLVQASRVLDAVFLRQVWSGNEAMLLDLSRDQSATGRA